MFDERNCPHCVRQCQAGPGSHVFATEQFDRWAGDDRQPLYPKLLIFRLHNACNLACIMCDGQTASRIRKERDKLPNPPSRFGPRFFKDMEAIIPHVDHVEFYGGEPFLVRAHTEILEIIRRTSAKCTIYVNTNGVSVTRRARVFLEELNFKTIAVSMDAVSDELHAEVRSGMRQPLFLQNMDYFLDLRKRRGVAVMLNVTEHRKNWFELPEIFRFAQDRHLYLHINTCIHPHNVTLYTLPTSQLRYVLDYFRRQRDVLLRDYPKFSNLANYDFLISLCRGELEGRGPNWEPVLASLNHETDGLLAAPRPGVAPFESPDAVATEANRIVDLIGGEAASRMLDDMLTRLRNLPDQHEWVPTAKKLEHMRARLAMFS